MSLLVLLGSAVTVTADDQLDMPKRPNFVFFLVDDLGWGSMGAYGNSYHETPNFDRLCALGMKFTHAYSACTVCSPSRAAILTGQYPARIHLTDWIAGHGHPKAKLKIPDWSMQMDHSHTTLAEALQQNGYRTAFFGKWHLMPVPDQDRWPEHTPEKHGFDVNVGGREWGQPKGRGKYFYPFDMPGLQTGEDGEYLTDRLTDEAIKYLDQHSDQPFLIYMSYYTVHGPIMAKPTTTEYFANKPRELKATKIRNSNPAEYAAMHKSLDESVGRILDKVKSLGLSDNTIVIFTGDNGGDFNSVCGGLRGYKGFAFEGGTREPTCIVWPGVTPAGSTSDTPIIGMDFYPTILDMAGLPPNPDQHRDGLSLVPLLKQNGGLDRDTLYWHYPHYHRTKPYGAIRHQDWKLIEFFEDGELLLFDLANDPGEERDLAKEKPQKAQELLRMLQAWRQEVDAQMPMPNPDYEPEPRNKQRTRAKQKAQTE